MCLHTCKYIHLNTSIYTYMDIHNATRGLDPPIPYTFKIAQWRFLLIRNNPPLVQTTYSHFHNRWVGDIDVIDICAMAVTISWGQQ